VYWVTGTTLLFLSHHIQKCTIYYGSSKNALECVDSNVIRKSRKLSTPIVGTPQWGYTFRGDKQHFYIHLERVPIQKRILDKATGHAELLQRSYRSNILRR